MNARAWRVRAMEPSDVATVLAIQRASPEAARWSAAGYERAEGPAQCFTVAEGPEGIAGFLVGRVVSDEFEILNMAVHPDARRQGAASLLLANALDFGSASGATQAFLEVRESNRGAIAFYERHGFTLRGRRPHYYAGPVEDALVLARHLA